MSTTSVRYGRTRVSPSTYGHAHSAAERQGDWHLAKRIEQKAPDRVDAPARLRAAVAPRRARRAVEAQPHVGAERDHGAEPCLRAVAARE